MSSTAFANVCGKVKDPGAAGTMVSCSRCAGMIIETVKRVKLLCARCSSAVWAFVFAPYWFYWFSHFLYGSNGSTPCQRVVSELSEVDWGDASCAELVYTCVCLCFTSVYFTMVEKQHGGIHRTFLLLTLCLRWPWFYPQCPHHLQWRWLISAQSTGEKSDFPLHAVHYYTGPILRLRREASSWCFALCRQPVTSSFQFLHKIPWEYSLSKNDLTVEINSPETVWTEAKHYHLHEGGPVIKLVYLTTQCLLKLQQKA